MVTRLTHYMETHKIHLSARVKKTMRTVAVAMIGIGFIYSLTVTMAKNVRFHAAETKENYTRAMDLSPNLATVWQREDGSIFRWTHGMTLLTGRTSKEMIGKNLALIDPDHDKEQSVIKTVYTYPVSDWLSEKYVDVLRKDGSVIHLRMNLRDINVPTEAEPFRTLTFDQLGVDSELLLPSIPVELTEEGVVTASGEEMPIKEE